MFPYKKVTPQRTTRSEKKDGGGEIYFHGFQKYVYLCEP